MQIHEFARYSFTFFLFLSFFPFYTKKNRHYRDGFLSLFYIHSGFFTRNLVNSSKERFTISSSGNPSLATSSPAQL